MSGTPTKQFPSFPPSDLAEPLNPPHAAGHSHIPADEPPRQPEQHAGEDTNMDMDMTQAPEPGSCAPPPTGRIPTPIQPSFMTQVRGNSWAETGPDAEARHPNGVNNMGHQPGAPFAPPPDQTVPRTVAADEWNAVRNRRLPSPISEGEDAHAHPPGMVLDGSTTNLAHRLASQVSITTPGEQREDPMGEACHEHEHEAEGGEAGGATTPSPGRKGHTRSRHTIDSWTWQPGMKKTFSMGYRTDCEKCRLKVPGHFNHIIIS